MKINGKSGNFDLIMRLDRCFHLVTSPACDNLIDRQAEWEREVVRSGGR